MWGTRRLGGECVRACAGAVEADRVEEVYEEEEVPPIRLPLPSPEPHAAQAFYYEPEEDSDNCS